MIKQNYTLHIFALSFIFTLGNAVIFGFENNLIDLILFCVLSVSIVLMISFMLKVGQKNKAVCIITTLLLLAVAIYGATITFVDYIIFLKKEQMTSANSYVLALIFGIMVVIFTTRKKQAIYKYCLFTFVIIVATILLCFIGGIKNFDFNNLNYNFFKNSFSLKPVFRFFLPVAVLPIFNNNESKEIKITVLGILFGFASLFITALQSTLTLGTNHKTAFSYLKSVSVISSGSLFTRLDGMIWFLFFVSAIIKITVCLNVFLKSIKKQS